MEHLIRTAFWIVTLSVTLGGCYPAPETSDDWNIYLMQKEVKCPEDSLFYTPENIETDCIKAAMQCVRIELQTVKLECNDTNERIDQAIEILEMEMQNEDGAEPTISNSCACERQAKKPFSDFLTKYKRLTEQFKTVG